MLKQVAVFGFGTALMAILAGCGDADSQESIATTGSPNSTVVAARGESVPRLEFRHDASRKRVETFADDGTGPMRVRISALPQQGWNVEVERGLRDRQLSAHARRQACLERTRRPAPTAEDRHDAWLEVCSKLERAAAEDPADLLVQRDLLNASVSLLGFERDSSFASSLCRSACDRLALYVSATHPSEPDEAATAASAEAWLYFHKKLYPAAAESLERIPKLADRQPLAAGLDMLKQRRFLPLETWTIAGCTVRAFRTIGVSPDEDLVWPECHFLISPTDVSPSPAQTIGYTLAMRTEGGERRFYLRYHAFGETELVLMYGGERPGYSVVKQHVNELIQAAAAKVKGAAVTRGTTR